VKHNPKNILKKAVALFLIFLTLSLSFQGFSLNTQVRADEPEPLAFSGNMNQESVTLSTGQSQSFTTEVTDTRGGIAPYTYVYYNEDGYDDEDVGTQICVDSTTSCIRNLHWSTAGSYTVQTRVVVTDSAGTTADNTLTSAVTVAAPSAESLVGDCASSNPFDLPGCKTTICGLCSVLNVEYRCVCEISKTIDEEGISEKTCSGVKDTLCAAQSRPWEENCKNAGGSCIPLSILHKDDNECLERSGLESIDTMCDENSEYICCKELPDSSCGNNKGDACCYNGCKNGLICCEYDGEESCQQSCRTKNLAIRKISVDGDKIIIEVTLLDYSKRQNN
jgi:hypothetical protein